MMRFDSDETEEYFFEEARKIDLRHVNCDGKKIWTLEDIEELFDEIERLGM